MYILVDYFNYEDMSLSYLLHLKRIRIPIATEQPLRCPTRPSHVCKSGPQTETETEDYCCLGLVGRAANILCLVVSSSIWWSFRINFYWNGGWGVGIDIALHCSLHAHAHSSVADARQIKAVSETDYSTP